MSCPNDTNFAEIHIDWIATGICQDVLNLVEYVLSFTAYKNRTVVGLALEFWLDLQVRNIQLTSTLCPESLRKPIYIKL